MQRFEQRDSLGLAHGRVRREEHAFGPDQRRAALLVGHVEPRAVLREIRHDRVRAAVRRAVDRRAGPSSSTALTSLPSECAEFTASSSASGPSS